jgi:hypothetical protein
MDTLSLEETEKFFEAGPGLLAFVNNTYALVENFGHPKKPAGPDQNNIVPIKSKLWENTGIIDEYIDLVWDAKQNREHPPGLEKPGGGNFFTVRFLKNHAVFCLKINNLALKGEVCCSLKVVTLGGLIPWYE